MSADNEAVASALELLLINQNGIGAAVEELAKWVAERGSVDVADNAVTALQVLDLNAEGIASVIRCFVKNDFQEAITN
ncbi:hypothetical protein [Pseudomonas sp. NPDC086278]|uniref:hypothetical protein n=1 Tax=Pseudomonas sp. NPDC086278 TaxID=3390646 RepID=UPI003D0628AD